VEGDVVAPGLTHPVGRGGVGEDTIGGVGQLLRVVEE
jgi:hypothetical protein